MSYNGCKQGHKPSLRSKMLRCSTDALLAIYHILQRYETTAPWVQDTTNTGMVSVTDEGDDGEEGGSNSTIGLTGSLRYLAIAHHAISSIGACCNDNGILLETLLTAANALPPVRLIDQ